MTDAVDCLERWEEKGKCFIFARGKVDEITGLKSVVASWKAIEITVHYS
jgi:hypothetical protein